MSDQVVQDFQNLYPQLKAGKKRVDEDGYGRDYIKLLNRLTTDQWQKVKRWLIEEEWLPYPIQLEKKINAITYSSQSHSGYPTDPFETDSYCRDCLEAGVVPAYEELKNGKYHQIAYKCRCSKGEKFSHLRPYFDEYPEYQFPIDDEEHDNYIQAYLDGMYAIMEERDEAREAGNIEVDQVMEDIDA